MNASDRFFIIVAKVLTESIDGEYIQDTRYFTEPTLEKAYKKRKELEDNGSIRHGSVIRIANSEGGSYASDMSLLTPGEKIDDWNTYLDLTKATESINIEEEANDKDFVLCNLPTESEMLMYASHTTPIATAPTKLFIVRLELGGKDDRFAAFSSEEMATRFCKHLEGQDAYREYIAQILSLEMNKPELTLSSSAKPSIAISTLR